MELNEKLKNLPSLPGVYLMQDMHGNIIYIGKARVLKNRVKQYFNASKRRDVKVEAMIAKICDFNYIITNNEVEALVLECNLIKEYKPPYNILLKDDKGYSFIKIDQNVPYPKIEVTKKVKNDGAEYFGPFMAGISTGDMLDVISDAFPLRSCKQLKAKRPCLNHHINRCLAPCCLEVKSEYSKAVEDVVKFLSGQDKDIKALLTFKMNNASQAMDFEGAIRYRDKLQILDKIVRRQVAVLKKDYDIDIFAVAGNGLFNAVSLIVVRAGKMVGEQNAIFCDASDEISQALGAFIRQYYIDKPVNVSEIVVSHQMEDVRQMEQLLSEAKSQLKGKPSHVNIVKPQRGVKRQLVDMALKNAEETLRTGSFRADARRQMTYGAVELLQATLKLERLPRRIEAYDISNISGQYKVASMVVFVDGEPQNKQYRRFKIKTVEGANDFASMNEALGRRLSRLSTPQDLPKKQHDCQASAIGQDLPGKQNDCQMSVMAQDLPEIGQDLPGKQNDCQVSVMAQDLPDEQADSQAVALDNTDLLNGEVVEVKAKVFDDSFSFYPDLILIDGGKGQLSSAYSALCDSGHKSIQIISLAKEQEGIYTLHDPEPILLKKSNAALNLLIRIRDEAHRFAISYFRKLKASKEFTSQLKEIEGIGKAKIESLYRKFKTFESIAKASDEELKQCKGINVNDIKRIREYFEVLP